MESIITSLLDNDMYKFSMQSAAFELFPDAMVEYALIFRHEAGLPAGFRVCPSGFVAELRRQIDALCELKFAEDEIDYLCQICPFLSSEYLDWLLKFKLSSLNIRVMDNGVAMPGIRIQGSWIDTILFEVPLMAIISELYFKMSPPSRRRPIAVLDQQDMGKAVALSEVAPFVEMGTRRRFSKSNQKRVVSILKNYGGMNFMGTSNVLLARDLGIKPIGTMAHEWIMFHAAAYGYRSANQKAMEGWEDVFGENHDMLLALTDTYTTGTFFENMDPGNGIPTDIFDWKGFRQDSGDPSVFISRLRRFFFENQAPMGNKTVVFSDGLSVDDVQGIHGQVEGDFKDVYGIGTHFSNDVGAKPLNMVIKMTAADPCGCGYMIPTVKLSDTKGKHTGRSEVVENCKWQLGIE